MNIKDFLIENYIWILIIILITIITIIGFLADRKKNPPKSKKGKTTEIESTSNESAPVPANNATPIQYNPQEHLMQNQVYNNMAVNQNDINNQMQPTNQLNNIQNVPNMNNLNNMNINNMVQEQQPQAILTGINNMNNPAPVENITQNVNPEPIYQPLSEQKPVISPRPVPNFDNMTNNNQEMINPIGNAMNINNQNNIPQPIQTNYNQPMSMPEPMRQEPIMNSVPNYNIPNQVPQQMNNNMNTGMNTGNIQNYNQNNTTIPEPINVIPTPQPINPQPIMNGMNNTSPVMQQNNYAQPTPQQNLNQPQPMPQQTNQMNNQPVSFVFGPQNNNQNM